MEEAEDVEVIDLDGPIGMVRRLCGALFLARVADWEE
jgi:hypothetical protein